MKTRPTLSPQAQQSLIRILAFEGIAIALVVAIYLFVYPNLTFLVASVVSLGAITAVLLLRLLRDAGGSGKGDI
jgi:hypothetical protein